MTRRFFQFSLGTLLVFVAAICVVLAVRANRQHNRRVAIAKIEELGGEVLSYSAWSELPKSDFGPATKDESLDLSLLAKLLGDDNSTKVFAVIFMDNKRVTDADLANLLPFGELQRLYLTGNTNVTDDGIARCQKAFPNCWIVR